MQKKSAVIDLPDGVDIDAINAILASHGVPPIRQPKKGGRPRVDDKRIAVFLAKIWMEQQHGATAGEFYEWAAAKEQWGYRGITDDAHARSMIREAEKIANNHFITIWPDLVMAVKTPITEGANVWIWAPGMNVAIKSKIDGEVTVRRQRRTIWTQAPHQLNGVLDLLYPRRQQQRGKDGTFGVRLVLHKDEAKGGHKTPP